MYHDHSRALQDQFGSRALADRLEEVTRPRHLHGGRHVVHRVEPLLLPRNGRCGGSARLLVQGRGTGLRLRRRAGPSRFPDYDGNGMFKSLGNICVNPTVGLLFIALQDRPRRLRVNGTATFSRDDPLLAETVGAQLMVRVKPRADLSRTARAISRRCSSWSRRSTPHRRKLPRRSLNGSGNPQP